MQIHEIAITIGAFGTMASAIVATSTYISATRRKNKAQTVHEASLIRQNLQGIVNEIKSIEVQMIEGISLFAATVSIVDEIKDKLGNTATAEEIKSVLHDDQLMLSACVNGWHKSKASKEISNNIALLRIQSAKFTGGYKVIGNIIDLFRAIASDGYSPLNFHRILQAHQTSDVFMDRVPLDKGVTTFSNAITVSLQTNSATYFASRYMKAIEEISEFLGELTNSIAELNDADLINIERKRLSTRAVGATRTNEIRQLVRAFEGYIKPSDVNTLLTMVDNIELYISKENASQEAERLSRK
ncbi:MAG: hypothetical protein GY797_08495 [Deltaproteobacteria bacterium]|nr:hypothetical protein [Deltaproteobacteria bacterium]